MRQNPLKTLFLLLFFIVLSISIVGLLNKQYIDIANRPIKEITPETYTDQVKSSIEFDDIIKITGTPNLLLQVSQEPGGERKEDEAIYHYVGLNEFSYDFVVKIKKGKLEARQQSFIGKVIGISQTEFGTRIKNSLNKPINFEESVNSDAASELDSQSKQQISQKSEAKFTDATLLVLDEETVNLNNVYSNIVIHSTLLSILFIAIFRKSIFGFK